MRMSPLVPGDVRRRVHSTAWTRGRIAHDA
jgi:hypothetical protein